MAADTTLVKLMGAVYKEVVGKHQRYFYVLDEAKAPDLDRYHIDKNALDKLGMSANIPLSEMISLIPNDTISFKWSDHPFSKAKYVDWDHLPTYNCCVRLLKYVTEDTKQSVLDSMARHNIIPVPVSPQMTTKQAEKLRKKILLDYENRPSEEKVYYVLSKPIFSRDKKYVMLCIAGNGSGCFYVFNYVNEQWVIVYQGKCWVA